MSSGFYACTESGEVAKYTFTSPISFTHPEASGKSKTVLEFDGNVLRKKSYNYNGYLSDTDTASYSMIITPTEYTIKVTFYNGLEYIMWYDVKGDYISWEENLYLNIN